MLFCWHQWLGCSGWSLILASKVGERNGWNYRLKRAAVRLMSTGLGWLARSPIGCSHCCSSLARAPQLPDSGLGEGAICVSQPAWWHMRGWKDLLLG